MMASKSAMLFVLLLVVVAINAQSVDFSAPTGSFPVGTWSPWYTITATNLQQLPFTLTFVDTATNNPSVQFSATSFTFTTQTRTLSYRVRSDIDISTQVVNVVTDHTAATIDQPWAPFVTSFALTFVKRTFNIDDTVGNGASKVNAWSLPIQVRVNVAPASDLSLTPMANNTAITFNPTTIVIKAGTLSGEFQWKSTIYGSLFDRLQWTVDGPDATLYNLDTLNLLQNRTYDASWNDWQVKTTVAQPNLLLGTTATVNQNSFYVYAVQNFTGSIDIIPQAADLTFSPSSVTLGPNAKTAVFNITAINYNNAVSKTVNIFTSGTFTDFRFADQGPAILVGSATVNIPRRQITVTTMSSNNDLTINNVTYISIAIPVAVSTGVTVSLSASRLGFNTTGGWARTTTVSFSGSQTSIVVAVLAQEIGSDTIYFSLAGVDAESYVFSAVGTNTYTVGYTIQKANIITTSRYQFETPFWVGVESAPIPIRASISPVDHVSVRIFVPNARVNPSVVTFRNGSEQQYFTITPWYTNSNVAGSFTTTIEYLLEGQNYDHYTAPAAAQIAVSQRAVQNAWSAHFTTDDSSTTVRHLHKTYKIWSSVNYIAKGEQVTVTPVSPFFSFSPKVLNFNGDTNRILLEATVTGVPSDGQAAIDYILGGKDGGLYTPVSTDPVTVGLRPLQIVGAVVTPDERNTDKKAVLLTNKWYIDQSGTEQYYSFSPNTLASYHVHSFMIRSFALPDKDLTITPSSPHVKFSPSKITLKASNAVKRIDYTAHTSNYISEGVTYTFNSTGVYAEANFTVEAYAAGLHVVTFGLSGADKDYYTRVAPTPMRFALVMRPDSEPFKAAMSSSSSLFPSFVVAAVVAVFALVM